MTLSLFLIQVLNGLQLGVLLFMLSAGLTLVFGIILDFHPLTLDFRLMNFPLALGCQKC